jgi:hypothetical protein
VDNVQLGGVGGPVDGVLAPGVKVPLGSSVLDPAGKDDRRSSTGVGDEVGLESVFGDLVLKIVTGTITGLYIVEIAMD